MKALMEQAHGEIAKRDEALQQLEGVGESVRGGAEEEFRIHRGMAPMPGRSGIWRWPSGSYSIPR